MTARAQVLEEHSLIIRDGRICDVLPWVEARLKYHPAAILERPTHALMPGLVNAGTRVDASLLRGFLPDLPPAPRAHRIGLLQRRYAGSEVGRDGALLSIAQMLKGGVTCFADRSAFPLAAAAAAAEQGIRAMIGMPVADTPGPWAQSAAEYLTKALNVRDEFKGHPSIATQFAPDGPARISDETFQRLATLADELDAGICVDLHESTAAIEESLRTFGLRPIERLESFGMLTPALTAMHMTQANEADIAAAERGGAAVCLCPARDLLHAHAAASHAAFAAAGLRLCMGSDADADQTLWTAVRLAALSSSLAGASPGLISPWDALAVATRGGASALGLESGIGTLEHGKWADVCCVDLQSPALQPACEPLRPLVFSGSRDMVTDVWVAGRQLLADSHLTRLDWPGVMARANAWADRFTAEG